jgi:hypothetical protein
MIAIIVNGKRSKSMSVRILPYCGCCGKTSA